MTMKTVWIYLAVVIVVGTTQCRGHSNADRRWRKPEVCNEETLMKYLISPKRYYKSLIPTSNNGPLTIGHRAELLRLVDFDFDDGGQSRILTIEMYEDWAWTDPRLCWNESQCNVKEIRLQLDTLWVPDINLFPSAAPAKDKTSRNSAIVGSMGNVGMSEYKASTTFCDPVVNGVAIRSPQDLNCNDEFDCPVHFVSWVYFEDRMIFEVLNPGGGMSTAEYTGSSDPLYEFVSTYSTITPEDYACCSGNFSTINYYVRLRKICP